MSTTTPNQQIVVPTGTDAADNPDAFLDMIAGVEPRLVQRYTSDADRDARNPTPATDELSIVAGNTWYDRYNGVAWVAVGDLRVGCTLERVAAQALPDAVSTTVSWDTATEATPGTWVIGTPTVITIPETGLWLATFGIQVATISAGRSFLTIAPSAGVWSGGTKLRSSFGANEDIHTVSGLMPLTAGDTFTCTANVDMAGASTMTATLTAYKVGS